MLNINDKLMSVNLDRFKVCADNAPTPLEYLIQQKGEIPTLPRRALALIKAGAKQGKTQFTKVLLSSFLGNDAFNFSTSYDNLKVVYIDTEQDPYNTYKLDVQVRDMADLDNNDARLTCYNVSDQPCYVRYETLLAICMQIKPDVVVLDGIVDLVANFNDLEECKRVVENLNILAKNYNLCLITLLHTNKTDGNARGHLGAFLEQKCTDVFEVKKSGDTISVKETASRQLPIDDFSFNIKSDGNLETNNPTDYRYFVSAVCTRPMTHTEIKTALMAKFKMSESSAKRFISSAKKYNILALDSHKLYTLTKA